jgi:hypothetical protein
LLKAPALFNQVGFAQQATGVRGEAREEEIFLQPPGLERWQAMAIANPVFGAQVFQVQPQGWA